jgi:hypothetical protein
MSHHVDAHGATHTVTTHGSDMRAAFTGLVAGVIALLAVVITIVMLTNKKFEGHEGAPAATHGAAAPTTPH